MSVSERARLKRQRDTREESAECREIALSRKCTVRNLPPPQVTQVARLAVIFLLDILGALSPFRRLVTDLPSDLRLAPNKNVAPIFSDWSTINNSSSPLYLPHVALPALLRDSPISRKIELLPPPTSRRSLRVPSFSCFSSCLPSITHALHLPG